MGAAMNAGIRTAVALVPFCFGAQSVAVHAQEALVLDVSCLCNTGSNPKRFFGRIAVTPEKRDQIKALVEKNAFGLRQTITLRGNGCGKDGLLSGIDARCGDTSVRGPVTGGKVTFVSVPNTEFSGEVTIRITDNGGIPLVAGTPDDKPLVDDKRWPQASAIVVGGTVIKASPK